MEILQKFIDGWYWHFASYAVVCYTRENKLQHFTAKNRKGKHAEDNVITQLKSLLDGNKIGSPLIKVYVNNSPCDKCSEKISKFLSTTKSEHRIDLKIELVFSRFYRVRRPSNEENPHYTGRLPSPKQHEAQVEGLKKLYRHVVDLRTFNTEDWQDLAKTLGVNPVNVNFREKRCDLLRKDLEKVMGLTSIEIPEPPLKSKTEPGEEINKLICKEDSAGPASCPVPPKLRSLRLTINDKLSTSEEKWKDKCHDVMVTKNKSDEMEMSQSECNNVMTEEDTHDDVAKAKDNGDDCEITKDRSDSMGIVKGKCEDAASVKDKCNNVMTVENKYVVMTIEGNEGNVVLSAQEKMDDVMVAKDKCESMRTTKEKIDDGMTAKDKCGIMGTVKDTSQNAMTKEEKCNNVLTAENKCNEVMTAKDKWDQAMTTKGKCDNMGTLEDSNDDVMTAKDKYDKWDNVMIVKDKCDETKTAQDKRDNLNTAKDKCDEMGSSKETDIKKKQEYENTSKVSTEANILEKADELKELKLRAARTCDEKEMLVSEAEYSFLKYLKLYYEVRQLERDLGIPEESGVNSVITTKVPFKLKD